MEKYLPYIVTVLCSLITYIASRMQSKSDMEKLEKQHELDIEKEREIFAMEKEKLELEHRHQLELIQKEAENKINVELTNTMVSEAMKLPAVREQISLGVKNGSKRKHK